MTLEQKIQAIYEKTLFETKEAIEIIFLRNLFGKQPLISKELEEKIIEDYLKKRGYTVNYVLGKRVLVKDFTCVFFEGRNIEVWHDKTKNNKSVKLQDSYITGLPIVLNYMERI